MNIKRHLCIILESPVPVNILKGADSLKSIFLSKFSRFYSAIDYNNYNNKTKLSVNFKNEQTLK